MSDGHWLWEGERGQIEIRQLGPAFATLELIGRADDDSVPTIDEALRRITPAHGLEMYWDANRLDSFGSRFRSVCTEHILAHRKTIKTVAVLSSSALVAMAVSATNLALGGMLASYRDPDKFFADQRAAAERHGIAPDSLAKAQ